MAACQAGLVDFTEIDPDCLYHLVTGEEWEAHRRAGTIEPPSLAAEGFVHCSWGRQVEGTVQRHFPEVTDLLALEVDPERLGGVRLVEEDSYGSGQEFPHVYGPLPLDAVVSEHRIR